MDIVAPFFRVAPEEHVLVKERAQESGYALIQDFPDLEAALEGLFALGKLHPCRFNWKYSKARVAFLCTGTRTVSRSVRVDLPFSDERTLTYNLKASVSYEADWISSAATTRGKFAITVSYCSCELRLITSHF